MIGAMDIAVLGTGVVGRTLAGRLDELGHRVAMGTRDPASTRARPDSDVPPWLAEHPAVTLETFADAAAGAELVVNATNGQATLEVLAQAGAQNLAGKPLMDLSNPLDFSQGFPPTLFVKDTDSLGEQVQRAFPDARVVKTLNTLNASLMVDPAALGAPTTVFVSGDDAAAKATVTTLLESFGWEDVLDLGPLATCRGTELYLPLWLRTMQALGTAQFNLKIIR